MRISGVLLASFCLMSIVQAAEPAKVSVIPTGTVIADTVPPKPMTMLEGTLVPAPTKTVEMSVNCSPPIVSERFRDRFLPVSPTVCPPTPKDCGDCGTSCGTTLFRGPRVTTECGTNVCDSPGRPGLFAGFFCPSMSSCTPCKTATCEKGGSSDCSISCCSGTILMRIKGWLCFQPCEGPRIGWFRPEPYVSATMTVFPCTGCKAGTCHGSAGCGTGLGVGSRMAREGCATGNGSDGAGLGGRLLGGHSKCPQDCNGAEPKLGGTSFNACYRFATVEPKQFGTCANSTDASHDLARKPKAKVEIKKEEPSYVVTPQEQASMRQPMQKGEIVQASMKQPATKMMIEQPMMKLTAPTPTSPKTEQAVDNSPGAYSKTTWNRSPATETKPNPVSKPFSNP